MADLRQYHVKYPEEFRILQYAQELLARKLMVRTRLLSKELKQAQINALTKQKEGVDTNVNVNVKDKKKEAKDYEDFMYYCPICYRINSFIRSYGTDSKKCVSSGLQNCMTDFHTDRVDVNGNKTITKLVCDGKESYDGIRCIDSELVKTPMLGRVILYGQPGNAKLLSICPTCGGMCIYNSGCVFNENGFTCFSCTEKKRVSTRKLYSLSEIEIALLDIGIEQRKEAIALKAQLKEGEEMPEGRLKEAIDMEWGKVLKKGKKKSTYGHMYPRCDICSKRVKSITKDNHLNLERKEGINLVSEIWNDHGIVCCVTHLCLSPRFTFKDFLLKVDAKEAELTMSLNEDCISENLCQCSDLKTTCTGFWNKNSFIAYLKMLKSSSRMIEFQNSKKGKEKRKYRVGKTNI
jgi:hypothetical protein